MATLDVSPMIRALQYAPQEFELTAGWLHHGRSGHSFRFDANDQVEVSAACNCAMLAPTSEHSRDLAKAFRGWERDYWRPLQINREFASHFKPGLRSMLIVLTGRLHNWLMRPSWSIRRAMAAAARIN
jgi:hypothetical protein